MKLKAKKTKLQKRHTLLLTVESAVLLLCYLIVFHFGIGQRFYREVSYRLNNELDMENGVFTGNTEFGELVGDGEFVFDTGTVYRGSFENSDFNGSGILEIPNIGYYDGEFVDSFKEGQGTFVWANGDSYIGLWKRDMMDGDGVYTSSSGTVYSGTFSKNTFWQGNCSYSDLSGSYLLTYKDGEIIYADIVFSDGTTYVGGCCSKGFNGDGDLNYISGDNYTGSFIEGLKSGKGSYVWAGGDSYSGQWENDKMSGNGVYTFSDGLILTGTFSNNKYMSGTYVIEDKYGTYRFTYENGNPVKAVISLNDGSKYDGGVNAKGLNGSATITYKNGDTYKGGIVDGQKAGEGEYKWNNGASYTGKWSSDLMNGSGTYYYPDSSSSYKLVGSFKDGRPNGECTYYLSSSEYYKTSWENGKCVKVTE